MKRILFATRDLSYVGGTEEFIKNLLLLFYQNKNLKFFLLEIEGHGKFENQDIYKILKKRHIKLISFNKDIQDIASLGKIEKLVRIIENYKINVVHSFLFNADFVCCAAKLGPKKMWQDLSKTKSFNSLCRIVPSIKDFKNSKIKSVNFTWVSSKTIDVSIALEKETVEWIERKRIIDEELEGVISHHCDVVLPVFKKGLRKWGKLSKRTILIPCVSINSRDMKIIDRKHLTRNMLREKYGLNPNVKVFVSVARLAPEKGLDKTLNLFRKEKPTSKNVLFIAGSGSLEKQLRRESYGNKNINFLGRLNRDQIFDLLVAGDVFVLLSRSEGFPLAIQEAMAAEKPIWATNVGGVSDLVTKSNGVLCEVDNDRSIRTAFEWFKRQDLSTLEIMGRKSKSKIVNSFMLEKVSQKLVRIYLNQL